MTRKEKILTYVKQVTLELLNSSDIDNTGAEAIITALDLGLDRANVSKELNLLWTEGKLIKAGTKPIFYLDRELISNKAKDIFIPHLLTKGQKLSDFIYHKPSNESIEIVYSIDELIGSDGSLKDQILKAKAAISYPPSGIHTLMIGNIGVGKLQFAKYLYDYALKTHCKNTNSQFLHVNCQDYSSNHRLFEINIFGVGKAANNAKKGLIEQAAGGVIYFNGIQKLSNESIESLTSLLETNTFTKIGETAVRQLDVMFIFSCSEDSAFINSTLAKLIPITISLPDIDQRGIYEKIELILSYFSQEAQRISKTIFVHKDIVACFATVTYRENLAQLRSEIKMACSKAYLDTLLAKSKTMYISFGHLSNQMLAYNDKSLRHNADSMRILSSIKDDYLVFESDGKCEALTYLKESPKNFDLLRTNQFVDIFLTDIVNIDDLQDFAIENLSCLQNCGPTQITALKNNIHPFVYQTVYAHISSSTLLKPITNNFQLLYGILLHITNLIKRLDNGISLEQPKEVTSTQQIYTEEFQIAQKILEELKRNYGKEISSRETSYLAIYLAIARQWVAHINVSILVISHGSNIASSLVEYVKTILSEPILIDSIDFKDEMQLNDLLELSCLKAIKLDQGAGVLIITDMVPLTSVHEHVFLSTKVKCRTIYPLSLPLLIEAVEMAKDPLNSLDRIMMSINHTHTNEESIAINEKDGFIEKLTHEFLEKSLCFLNANKGVETLSLCLNKITNELNIEIPRELTVKFLVHGVYMLERVIRKEPFTFSKLTSFVSNNAEIVQIVEKNLNYANEVYGINIPTTEIAYLTEILLPFTKINQN
jgi:transcriptional regulator with AAA-type ATPase domain/transcriptional regulatory protein LevR